MRGQIIDSVFALMATDPDIFFLTGDMGINLVEKFEGQYPDRFANVGIAEQNLIGVSAGLANLGYRPFVYSISNFLIHRCFEQIRNDICLHRYPITLLGTSTGYDNAPLGPTHHIVDDWGALKALPGIDIYCPSSTAYAAVLVERIIEEGRPAYVRIPKGSYSVPAAEEHLVSLPGETHDILLVTYGSPAQACIEARDREPNLSVLVVNRLRPLDQDVLEKALEPYRRIIVVEDHFPEPGLYGSFCEFAARRPLRARIESMAPRDYTFDVGTASSYFGGKYGLDVTGILSYVRSN